MQNSPGNCPKHEDCLRVMFLGDMVGRRALVLFNEQLPEWKRQYEIDLVIVNAENVSDGAGISVTNAYELWRGGVNVVTSGDHVWKHKDFVDRMKEFPFIIRPANYPPDAPGKGYVIWVSLEGVRVVVINIIGRVFMYPLDCPFRAVDGILSDLKGNVDIVIVDFHAEATSEKLAMMHFLDGRVSALFGTHTHVPTADLCITPNGMAYMTDVGMVGPYGSILGRVPANVVEKYIKGVPVKFPVMDSDIICQGVLVDIEKVSGKAVWTERWERILTRR